MSTKCSAMPFDGVLLELRKSRRYRLFAPASFSWARPDGLLQEGRGTIRDISERGVYITGEVVPLLGAHLDVDVYLPSLELAGNSVQLHGEGIVIRVDQGPESAKGFAADVLFQTESSSGPTIVNPNHLQ